MPQCVQIDEKDCPFLAWPRMSDAQYAMIVRRIISMVKWSHAHRWKTWIYIVYKEFANSHLPTISPLEQTRRRTRSEAGYMYSGEKQQHITASAAGIGRGNRRGEVRWRRDKTTYIYLILSSGQRIILASAAVRCETRIGCTAEIPSQNRKHT